MQLARFSLRNALFVAPMAGVSDRPFRQVCKAHGAGLAVSEMVTSNALLYATEKTRHRTDHQGETGPVSVQIAGADPAMMAEAARHNVDRGAQIIDINMGCPAKKVCNVMAGSALLRDEALVGKILDSVVAAVSDTPVTLKIRTGWSRAHRNAPRIARIAEAAGIRLLAVHGRTREDAYMGEAEYDTIAEVKSRVAIPVIANGDITSAEKARSVLQRTGADGLMIGRGAQGRPDFPRNRTLSRHGAAAAAAFRGRDPSYFPSPPRRHPRLLWRGKGGAHRPQAHGLVCRRLCRRRPFSPDFECAVRPRGTICRGGSLLRPTGRSGCRLSGRGFIPRGTRSMSSKNEIAESVVKTLDQYFRDLDGEKPAAIYELVMKNAERPMLEFVLQVAGGNQTAAAEMLGINRNTLRRKLADYDIR